VQLRLNALVPQEYVADVSVRLGIYRRLGMAQDAQELQRLAAELRERFGPLPQELQALLEVMHLRLLAEAHQVRSITQLDGRLRFSLAQGASPSVQGLLRRFGSRVRFLPEGFELALRGPALKEAREALQCLTG
jgi:transcription-repair coupling factor (superfamily II helicase)